MSGLTENCWILIFVSAFNLLQYNILLKVHEEYLASHKYVVVKGMNILIASDNYRYYTKNSTSGTFLEGQL